MEPLRLFQLANVAMLLVGVGHAVAIGRGAWRSLALAMISGGGAFLIVGNAVLQGDPTTVGWPLAIHPDALVARQLDGAAAHNLLALSVGLAVIAAFGGGAAGRIPAWSILLAGGLFGGLVAPLAARQVWWGELRAAGVVDTSGAIALHLCAVGVAVPLRLIPTRPAGPHALRSNPSPLATAAGALIALTGLLAAAVATTVMQSPTTVGQAATNTGLGAGAGFLVGGAIAALTRAVATMRGGHSPGPWCGALAGAIATTAGAGRLSPLATILAAIVASTAGTLLSSNIARRLSLRAPAAMVLTGHFAGAAVAIAGAAGSASRPWAQQAALQALAGLTLTGLAASLAVAAFLIARLLATLMSNRAHSQARYTARREVKP